MVLMHTRMIENVFPEVVLTFYGKFGQDVLSESLPFKEGSENVTIRDGVLSALTSSFQTCYPVPPRSLVNESISHVLDNGRS